MIVDPRALRVNNLVLRKPVQELISIFVDVQIVAAVPERTLTSAFIEQFAGYLIKRGTVLLAEGLFGAPRRVEIRWNDQVAGLTADRASAEVMLGRSLVIRSSPAPDAFEAENVIALIKHSKLASRG